MIGTLVFDQSVFEITKAELHVPLNESVRMFYLHVSAGAMASFALWEFEISNCRNLDDLDNNKMHVHFPETVYDDDTLGTDIIGVDDSTGLNYIQVNNGRFGYGEIQVDFKKIEGDTYRVSVFMTLGADEDKFETDEELEDYENLDEEDHSHYPHHAKAVFTVTVDEADPN